MPRRRRGCGGDAAGMGVGLVGGVRGGVVLRVPTSLGWLVAREAKRRTQYLGGQGYPDLDTFPNA